jgi:PelA/Pel-15E family pectate lyase
MRVRRLAPALAGVVAAACASARPAMTPDMDDVPLAAETAAGETPTARRERPLLAAERLAALPAAERAAWARFLEGSRATAAADREAMRRELAARGVTRMDAAPKHAGFAVRPAMTGAWFAGDEARAQTAALLSWQTPSGGWSKRVDMSAPRRPGMAYGSEGDGWAYVPTLDNDATTEQLVYLARALDAGVGGGAEREAYGRGVRYLLQAQLPTGCWPQVYPLQGSYHDAATFNDEASVNVLRVLQDVVGRDAAGAARTGLATAQREAAGEAVRRGVDCLVRAQVVERDTLTAWGQQHDPLTLRPVDARSYEHASLASKESAAIVDFLLEIPDPDARVVAAVHGAADWFRRASVTGYAYDYRTGLRAEPGAGPIWARMYELGTGRPLFSNRDGVRRYRWDELTDRRQGYAWYTTDPASTLRRYERWARTHPRTG